MSFAFARSAQYKWAVVAMLWFVCFFNYADRQAIFSVFPSLKTELHLSDVQLGIIGSSFMWMYALFGPLAGWLCDRLPRKTLILGGLIFWSAVTAATAIAHSYTQLIICRSLGGLGEAFYFPASMSLIGDYHHPDTRSRAMSIHQSSVYAGSIAGGAVSGYLGQYYSWRSSFSAFGLLGIALGMILWRLLLEPKRDGAHIEQTKTANAGPVEGIKSVFQTPLALLLMLIFMGANFVAVIFLAWMPIFLYRKFSMSLSMSGFSGTAYLQIASVLGVLAGGLAADALVKRNYPSSKSARMFVQSLGLLCGVPFLFLVGWSISVKIVVLAMMGFGFFKGLYDANIFASLYDVVPVEIRGTAAGLMNSIGWLGGGVAPVAIAVAASRYGMSACISATAAIYLMLGMLLIGSALMHAGRRLPSQ